ncbi:uncharacterized protein METZ01_LOCUS275728, partial [marine metagenome]
MSSLTLRQTQHVTGGVATIRPTTVHSRHKLGLPSMASLHLTFKQTDDKLRQIPHLMPLLDVFYCSLPNESSYWKFALPLNLTYQHSLCNDINALLIHFYHWNNLEKSVNF